MNSKVLIAGIAAVAAVAAVLALWRPGQQVAALRIAGMAAALPRADAETESVLPAALAAARDEAAKRGVRAFVLHRRGHRVFEHFAAGTDGTVELEGGALGAAVLQLALHEPGQAEGADAATAAALVSERIWLPLRAGDAWLSGDTEPGPRHCCMRARLDDWMRVADLLLGQGAYLGERILSADAVRALLAASAMPAILGDEPLLARDGTAFDLQPGVRLWIAPRRQLAMLVWGDDAVAHDTLLPNIVLRGLNDQAPAIGGSVSDIVPGH